MWSRGLLLLLVLWEGRPGACLPSDNRNRDIPVPVPVPKPERAKQNVNEDLLRQEVQQLSHLIAAFLAQPRIKTECRTPYVEVGGRCIVVLDETSGSWPQMRNHCNNLGGELLKVDDANLMADVIQYINEHNFDAGRYWIGASDTGHEGNWRWPDGSPVRMGTPFWGDYGNHGQQPSGGIPEGCANMPRNDHFFFHDGPCSEVNSAICEY